VRTIVRFAAIPAMAALAACGGDQGDTTSSLPDDLKKDLAAASASGLELASTARGYQPTRFVSAIESPTNAAPERRAVAKRRVPKPPTNVEPQQETTPDPVPEPTVEVAETPAPTPVEAPAPALDPAPVVTRPTPVQASYPSSSGNGESDVGRGGSGSIPGEVIGGIIGVVIRGGSGGIDHCEPRGGRRPNGGVAYPGTGGPLIGMGGIGTSGPNRPRMGRPTFPR
jgi:hypothetical protein